MDKEKIQDNNFVCMNSHGMVIDKSSDFNKQNCGFIADIVQKARKILPTNDYINNIEIFFDKTLMVIQDNTAVDLNMTIVVEKDK